MPLRAYEEFAPEPLGFPIGGKVYTVQPVGYREGLRITEMIQARSTKDEEELNNEFPESTEDLWRMVLGPAYDEMKADNIPSDALARAGFAAISDFQFGRDVAESVWESGLDPKALAENMTARVQQKDAPDSTPSRSTASGTPTRKRASTRSTTSRKR